MERPGRHFTAMRETAPLVQNITNFVAMNVMANVLLAIGASPAMIHARQEAAEFAGIAQALTVNIGTAEAEWYAAMEEAGQVMAETGKPWVLDPVGVGATGFRRERTARLVALKPTVIRGNASEILALAGLGAAGRGVDSGDSVETAQDAARTLAARTEGVVVVSGPRDFATDGSRSYHLGNGHPLMARVTAMGCSLNGVIAAFCVGQPGLEATVAALASYGLAGEVAAGQAAGPGSFVPAFLDALSDLDAAALDAGARIETA